MAAGHMHSVPPRRVFMQPSMSWELAAGSLPNAYAVYLECTALQRPSPNPCPCPVSHHLSPHLCCCWQAYTPACQLQAH